MGFRCRHFNSFKQGSFIFFLMWVLVFTPKKLILKRSRKNVIWRQNTPSGVLISTTFATSPDHLRNLDLLIHRCGSHTKSDLITTKEEK